MAKPSKGTGGEKTKKKKKSTNRIQDQMEFYFSNSNLRRDRFLREKLNESVSQIVLHNPQSDQEEDAPKDPETRLGLDLSIFLNFNNIKAVTTDVNVIKDSLSKSKLLSVYQVKLADTATWFVTRTDWIGKEDLSEFLSDIDGNNQDFDKRTIYCENLPINANQVWLRQLFSQFGMINLVSVPKFKGNQRIKQFCFIEFGDEGSVATALEFFQKFDGCICAASTESDHLQSIQKFNEEHKEEEPGVAKKQRVDEPKEAEDEDREEASVEKEPPKQSADLNDKMIFDLKIMPKVEWKRLRNKYLNLQREMVREMKKQAFYKRMQMGQHQSKGNKNMSSSAPVQKEKAIAKEEGKQITESTSAEGGGDAPQLKRRKRGREKVKKAIKKSSHIFFEA